MPLRGPAPVAPSPWTAALVSSARDDVRVCSVMGITARTRRVPCATRSRQTSSRITRRTRMGGAHHFFPVYRSARHASDPSRNTCHSSWHHASLASLVPTHTCHLSPLPAYTYRLSPVPSAPVPHVTYIPGRTLAVTHVRLRVLGLRYSRLRVPAFSYPQLRVPVPTHSQLRVSDVTHPQLGVSDVTAAAMSGTTSVPAVLSRTSHHQADVPITHHGADLTPSGLWLTPVATPMAVSNGGFR